MTGTRGPPEPGAAPAGGPPSRALLWGLGGALLVLAVALAVWTATDLDDDGPSAAAELRAGTSPWAADSDGDGLDDGTERDRGLDPLHADSDGDGLDDRAELARATNPHAADSDGDGLDDAREAALGTDPRLSDSDRDEVADGREVEVGTNPRAWDTDGDGLDDGTELTRGANPWLEDTDGDGLDDAREAALGPEDCDGDGVDRIAESDDDADGLRDVDEDPAWRCRSDTDGDGLDDGDERGSACVRLPDCDVDGLLDAEERGTVFDALDPDTFDVGLLDGVTRVFERSGQAPSPDGDGDGIPDAWESSRGLLDWTSFDPEPGRRDLLVEFVRVEGPDSAPFGPGAMAGAYERVETFFEDGGEVSMSWFETTVRLDEERRPPILPSSSDEYYREVLGRARASGNPYVTTVVLNPQHDQSQTTHQGVAPIRGMLAAVDYGAHTRVDFESPRSSFTISPLVESLIEADRSELLGGRGVTGGGRQADGDMFLTGDDWRLTWGPFWFRGPPVQRFDDGTTLVYERVATRLDEPELADTIAHELGHTLGLCHNTLADCRANLSPADRDEVGVSTMDPRREDATLRFLASEWERARGYLSCPPQRSVTRVAEGADRARVIDAKYAVTLETALDVGARQCQDRDPLPADLQPARDPETYRPPYAFGEADLDESATVYGGRPATFPAPTAGWGATWAYAGTSLALAAGAGGGVWRWRRP